MGRRERGSLPPPELPWGRDTEDLWPGYTEPTEVEAILRTLETDMVVRPACHQIEPRVRAHFFVSHLALALWRTIEKLTGATGIGGAVRIVLGECSRIKLSGIILPTSTGREIQLQCVSRPDGRQRTLLDYLGIEVVVSLGNMPKLGRPSAGRAPGRPASQMSASGDTWVANGGLTSGSTAAMPRRTVRQRHAWLQTLLGIIISSVLTLTNVNMHLSADLPRSRHLTQRSHAGSMLTGVNMTPVGCPPVVRGSARDMSACPDSNAC